MYYIFFFLLISNFIISNQIYIGKVEPLYKQTKISEVEGQLNFKNHIKEYSILKKKTSILKIEDELNILKLKNLLEKLSIQNEIITIKRKNYNDKLKIIQLSSYVKNSEKLIFLQAKMEKINIKNLINIEEDQIEKKQISLKKNLYLNQIFVNEGDFIQKGKQLFDYYDITKIKITIFLKEKDLKNIRKKDIYIDNMKSNFYINSISRVKDFIKVSTYKVILYKKNINPIITRFDQIVKIEFK